MYESVGGVLTGYLKGCFQPSLSANPSEEGCSLWLHLGGLFMDPPCVFPRGEY